MHDNNGDDKLCLLRIVAGYKMTDQNLNDHNTALWTKGINRIMKRNESSDRMHQNQHRMVMCQRNTELQERPTKESKEQFKCRPNCNRNRQEA
jgi:hypothetical protein